MPKAIALIKQAISARKLDKKEVDEKVKRILRLKFQMHLHVWRPIATQHLDIQLHTPQAHLLKQQLFEQAVTVVANEEHLIPLKGLEQLNIACLSIVSEATANKASTASETAISDEYILKGNAATLFPAMLKEYAPITHHTLAREAATPEVVEELASKLKHYQVVIVGIHDMGSRRGNQFGLRKEELQLLKSEAVAKRTFNPL